LSYAAVVHSIFCEDMAGVCAMLRWCTTHNLAKTLKGLLAAADSPACHMILSIMYRRSPHKIADLSHGAVYCCRPMMELLFARLPKDLQLHAIKQLARFVTTTTLASVTNETALICNAAAWAAPETGVELLLKPLLGKIEEEVKHDGTAGSGRMSKVGRLLLRRVCSSSAGAAQVHGVRTSMVTIVTFQTYIKENSSTILCPACSELFTHFKSRRGVTKN